MLTYFRKSKKENFNFKATGRIRKEQHYWRHVMQRVFAVIFTLTERRYYHLEETMKRLRLQIAAITRRKLEVVVKFDLFLRDRPID